MNDFSERMRAAAAAHTRRASETRAPQSLRASVAKARMLRTGGMAAIAVVGIAGIGAAGIGFTGMDEAPEPSPSASVDLSIDDGEVAYTTLAFPDEPPTLMPAAARELCGQPLPEDTATTRDFAVTFDVPAEMTLGGIDGSTMPPEDRPRAAVEYSGAGPLPAFVEDPLALLLRDGVVVGTTWPMSQDALQVTFETGDVHFRSWDWLEATMSCEGDNDMEQLDPGEYEIAFLLDIHNDEQTAATFSLKMRDLMLPARTELAGYREGSFECGDQMLWDTAIPITCRPNALPGIEIDEEAGTVTAPYDTKYFSRNVDLRFISEPLPVTLEETDMWFTIDDADLPTYERGSVPVCGDVYADIHSGSVTGALTDAHGGFSTVNVGDTLQAEMWIHAAEWATAEFTMPERPRLWITQMNDMDFESSEDDGVEYSYGAYEVIGWADASVASGDTDVEVIRYDGPSPLSLTVDAIEWCDGVDPAKADPVYGYVGALSMIAEPTTVTFDNGITAELDALVFHN